MSLPVPAVALAASQMQELEQAVRQLESRSFAMRIADYAGKPLDRVLKFMPGVGGALRGTVHRAVMGCLEAAIDSLEDDAEPPSTWLPKTLTGITGGLGGLFGAVALPVELPLTTTLMLRSIADIARHEGEDMTSLEARLACLHVFALGGRETDGKTDVGYFAARATLTKVTTDVVSYFVERTAFDASAPVVTRLVSEIVGRFGLVVSERAAASAIPVIGAVGGATVNMLFMDHFERVATAHFTIRRLERQHGRDAIRRLYDAAAARN